MSMSTKNLLEMAIIAKLFGDDNEQQALPASPLTENTAQNIANQNDLASIWSTLNESKQNPEKAAQINNNAVENDLKQYVDRQLNDVKKVVVDAVKNEQMTFKNQLMTDVESRISDKLKVLKANTSPIDTDEVLHSLEGTIQKNVKKLYDDIEKYIQDQVNKHDHNVEDKLTQEIDRRFKKMETKLESQIEDNIQISDIKPDKSILKQITGDDDVTRNVIGTAPEDEYSARDMQEDTSMAVNAEKNEHKKIVDQEADKVAEKKEAEMPNKKDIEDAEFKGVDPSSVSKIIGDGTDQVVDTVKAKDKEHQAAEKSAEKQDVKPSKSKESDKVDDDDPFVAPSVSFDKAVDMNDDHASNTHSKTMFDDAEEVENEEDAPENETDIGQDDNTTDVFDF